MENDEGHRIGFRESAKIFQSFAGFEKYSDIILDISSLPLNIYLPLLGKILRIIDKQRIKENKKNESACNCCRKYSLLRNLSQF